MSESATTATGAKRPYSSRSFRSVSPVSSTGRLQRLSSGFLRQEQKPLRRLLPLRRGGQRQQIVQNAAAVLPPRKSDYAEVLHVGQGPQVLDDRHGSQGRVQPRTLVGSPMDEGIIGVGRDADQSSIGRDGRPQALKQRLRRHALKDLNRKHPVKQAEARDRVDITRAARFPAYARIRASQSLHRRVDEIDSGDTSARGMQHPRKATFSASSVEAPQA